MRGRGDVGARQLSDQLHEDGRDGRAERQDQVMVVMVIYKYNCLGSLGIRQKHFTGLMGLDFEPISPSRLSS